MTGRHIGMRQPADEQINSHSRSVGLISSRIRNASANHSGEFDYCQLCFSSSALLLFSAVDRTRLSRNVDYVRRGSPEFTAPRMLARSRLTVLPSVTHAVNPSRRRKLEARRPPRQAISLGCFCCQSFLGIEPWRNRSERSFVPAAAASPK